MQHFELMRILSEIALLLFDSSDFCLLIYTVNDFKINVVFKIESFHLDYRNEIHYFQTLEHEPVCFSKLWIVLVIITIFNRYLRIRRFLEGCVFSCLILVTVYAHIDFLSVNFKFNNLNRTVQWIENESFDIFSRGHLFRRFDADNKISSRYNLIFDFKDFVAFILRILGDKISPNLKKSWISQVLENLVSSNKFWGTLLNFLLSFFLSILHFNVLVGQKIEYSFFVRDFYLDFLPKDQNIKTLIWVRVEKRRRYDFKI